MIEIIPKPIEEIPKWQKILVFVSIFILLIFIVASLILISLEKKAKISLQDLDEKIFKARTPEIVSLEKEILNYQKEIKDFSQLIGQHLFPSKLFPFLEEKTHPRTFFSRIDSIPRDSKISLSGQTESFLTLGQQLLIFQSDSSVKDLNLSGVSITKEGKIGFDLEISLDPKIFK